MHLLQAISHMNTRHDILSERYLRLLEQCHHLKHHRRHGALQKRSGLWIHEYSSYEIISRETDFLSTDQWHRFHPMKSVAVLVSDHTIIRTISDARSIRGDNTSLERPTMSGTSSRVNTVCKMIMQLISSKHIDQYHCYNITDITRV